MPDFNKTILLSTSLLILLVLSLGKAPIVKAYEGIENYYIRYDVKSSKNKFSTENLLMIPAKNDFRTEKFSQQSITGVISAASGILETSINKNIKEDALKNILVASGLKSITTKDLDTIISYEGAIITPINIIKNIYSQDLAQYQYTVQIEFSPIAFPDKWESMGVKHKIKGIITDFFQLFR